MTQFTTYTIKGKQRGFVWQFKYRLNGDLKSFEILEGKLTELQIKWLFSENFPATETIMKTVWTKVLRQNFEVVVGEPDLSFNAFWDTYGYKVKRVMAERSWKKLSEADRIKAFLGLGSYNSYLKRNNGIAKAHPSTYLNQRYFEDEWHKV